jgi:hypothetical protein
MHVQNASEAIRSGFAEYAKPTHSLVWTIFGGKSRMCAGSTSFLWRMESESEHPTSLARASPLTGMSALMPPMACTPRLWHVWMTSWV